jgi:two-component system response regulator RegX3
MRKHILLVEDESSISEPLKFLLEKEGYSVTVIANGTDAVDAFAAGTFELVLLDLMLPGIPGNEVCRQIRLVSDVPIIMLTAKDSEIDIVVGLELGADDYITKPYSSHELIARTHAVMRRYQAKPEDVGASQADDLPNNEVHDSDGIRLDRDRYVVAVRGEETKMPLREFELLELLMRHKGKVLTRSQLIDRVWGSSYFGDTKTLDVHIKRLRSRIEKDPSQPELITTVRGVGYRFS